MSEAGARFLVSGRVQGVHFRASTGQQARALELRGTARNLDDGRVEVVVAGPAQAIEQLACWLARGPALARVDALTREDHPPAEVATGFRIA